VRGGSLARLELAAVALLLLAALVPRLRDAAAPLDRGFDGQQGGFFAIAAINYERLGVARTHGYPVLNVDLGERGAAEGIWDRPEHWLSYTNHPPTVALLAWAALNAMAPPDWNAAWREGRGPDGFELALRFPFLALHALALLGLWWCVREGHGVRAGLVALALAAGSTPLVVYAGLVNYENPALACVLWGTGWLARHVRLGRRSDLALAAAAFVLGGAFTWAPLVFAVAWCALASVRTERARTLAAGLTVTAAAALPLLLHTLAARRALAPLGQPEAGALARARELWAPLLDGSAPLSHWGGLQAARWSEWFGAPALLAGGVGLLLALAALVRARGTFALRGTQRCETTLALALGGLACQLAFYRHTLDAQTSFLMLAAPGVCALGAVALDALAPRLVRLRAGLAPLVVLASSIALVDLSRAQALRHALRAPLGAAHAHLPAPELALPRETGACLRALLREGELGLHPAELGLNLAVTLHAWRSLWPVAAPDDPIVDAVARRAGLAHAPRRLLQHRRTQAPPGESDCAAWSVSAPR
jgi:hypothetical protein